MAQVEIAEFPDSLVDAPIQDSQGNDVVWIYALTTDGSTPKPLQPIGDEPDATRQAFWRRKAGMLMLIRSPWPLKDGRRIAWVAWVEVSPTFHRQGVATQLYTRAAQVAARDGFHLASDQTLSDEAKGFWTKQATKGRADAPVPRTGGRFVLRDAPPASLANPGPDDWRSLYDRTRDNAARPAEMPDITARALAAGAQWRARIDGRIARKKARAQELAASVGPRGTLFRALDPTRADVTYVLSPRIAGDTGSTWPWRMTRFDRIGAYGHTYHATPLAAVTDVLDYFGDIEIVERANPRPLREGDNRHGWPYAMQRETAEWRLAKARGKRAALQGITEHEKVRGLELESVSDPRVVFIITPGVRGDASWAGVEYPWQVSRFFRFAEGLQPIGHENARTLAEAVAKAVADSGGELRRTAMANPRKRPAVHAAGRGQRAGVQTVLCGARPGPSGLLAAYDIGEVTCGSCRRALRGGR